MIRGTPICYSRGIASLLIRGQLRKIDRVRTTRLARLRQVSELVRLTRVQARLARVLLPRLWIYESIRKLLSVSFFVFFVLFVFLRLFMLCYVYLILFKFS